MGIARPPGQSLTEKYVQGNCMSRKMLYSKIEHKKSIKTGPMQLPRRGILHQD